MDTEREFKALLVKLGCSDKASNKIWEWYTSPTQKSKNI
jgi:hypothetical protein